jgi:hypothetical protein
MLSMMIDGSGAHARNVLIRAIVGAKEASHFESFALFGACSH